MNGGRDVARAVDALRRGWPVEIEGTNLLAIETADEAALADFDRAGASDLLISGNRAVTLKLANQRDGVPTGPVRVARAPWIDLAGAAAIADPALDLRNPMKGPFRTVPLASQDHAEAALRLARLAGLLPALFIGGQAEGAARVGHSDVMAAVEAESLRIASRAKLPTRFSEEAEIVAFRSEADAAEHVALLIGSPGGAPPLVRLHSECLTGDVLGSQRCDCGPQLREAVERIAEAGGFLLYLRQEGRGIGLYAKLDAYALQDAGLDTYAANVALGRGEDERDYTAAAQMLRAVGVQRISLLSNNPDKAHQLEQHGITVAERVPTGLHLSEANARYLMAKRDHTAHTLDLPIAGWRSSP